MTTAEHEPREPVRQVWHFALLALVGFMVIACLALSGRAPLLTSFNNVAPAGPVPAGIVPDYGDDWSVIIHRSDWNARAATLLGRTGEGNPLRMGWVVREWSFLGLPLFATRQGDLAVFKEDSYGYRLAGLTEDQRAAIERRGGPGWFPFWRHCWGWIAVAAVAVFAWAELRWQARRRAVLGIM
ncbi:hypothetical protein [Sphingomonas sp.]|uniref:hypothetical protein n=1 Tax=Sphingomonas sp. TaxID=28214 RepID=UPI003B002C08